MKKENIVKTRKNKFRKYCINMENEISTILENGCKQTNNINITRYAFETGLWLQYEYILYPVLVLQFAQNSCFILSKFVKHSLCHIRFQLVFPIDQINCIEVLKSKRILYIAKMQMHTLYSIFLLSLIVMNSYRWIYFTHIQFITNYASS